MPIYQQNPRTAGRRLEDVVFVVTPDDQRLHTLNATAAEIWECAANGCTVEQAAASLVEHFKVDQSTAVKDVEACCKDFVSRRIFVCE